MVAVVVHTLEQLHSVIRDDFSWLVVLITVDFLLTVAVMVILTRGQR